MENKKNMKYLSTIIFLVLLITISACKKRHVDDNIPDPSSGKSITSYILKSNDNSALSSDVVGIISADTIFLSVPNGIDISSLKPTIVYSGISITPESGIAQDFTSAVGYTVKAIDNSTKHYVAVIKTIIKNTVYVGSTDGKLYALDGDNGSLKWSYTPGGGIGVGSPTYYNGTIFIGCSDQNMHAVDATTGLLKWKYLSHGNLSASTPTLDNGVLYFGSSGASISNCYLTAINAQTGALVWERQFQSGPWSPTVVNNRLYVSTFNGQASYDASNGQPLNSFAGSDICADNPLVVNGVMYAGKETKAVTAYNAISAAVIWNFSSPSGGATAGVGPGGPTLADGIIYNAMQTQMVAMDSATGVMRWRYIVNSGVNGSFSAPSVANKILYTGCGDSHFYALDAYTGTVRWMFGNISSSTTASNGTVVGHVVYFGSNNKNIYAVNAFNGTVRWQYPTGGPVYAGPCVVTDNLKVYHPGVSGEHQ